MDNAYEIFREEKVDQATEHALSAPFHETQRQMGNAEIIKLWS